ncbi:MAG TPA: hypothetical protein PK079_00710 [Leptospiraceae bacterium]|nr:hypothetical protein [Leptospiraceae bacterium]HMW03968.1 hypothetical protein [Leptospiraceae bacterium]HMX33606.1 hypothetical protein [Leptospiraceae bacterium]HMY29948.1 hypothetical protein [Leptospiraceae bacterium]HMZ66775.1 hypothetical protein [Leptospiraceae bacterium]
MNMRIFKEWEELTTDEKEELRKESEQIIQKIKKEKGDQYYTDALYEIHQLKKELKEETEKSEFKGYLIGVFFVLSLVILNLLYEVLR